MSLTLVFGASGALGKSIVAGLEESGHKVLKLGRTFRDGIDIGTNDSNWAEEVAKHGQASGVVWAQGINSSGTVLTTSSEELTSAFATNVGYIHTTLQQLVESKALMCPARTVVLSSIWQDHARGNKFAYMTSKAALSGFVKSAAIDLAEIGISMNAVLPGVIDTPMTRANLTADQVTRIEASTPGGKLAKPENIASSVEWLLSNKSAGINGQFITVDAGWTIQRHV